ncbi:MAG: hypothetical protein HOI24_04015 [Candidatus Magasanikbacteria bacterium]|nr:hypothetical protein [Candidatus Magasanikbacteria bacterium]
MKTNKKKHAYKHIAKLQNVYAITMTCLVLFLGYIIYFVHTYVYTTVIKIQEISFIQPDIQVETINFDLLDEVNTVEQQKGKVEKHAPTHDPFHVVEKEGVL